MSEKIQVLQTTSDPLYQGFWKLHAPAVNAATKTTIGTSNMLYSLSSMPLFIESTLKNSIEA
jgi:hypothetical protein